MQNEEQSFIELFTLGDFYVSDFIHENDEIERKKYDLTLLLDTKYELVKLKSIPPKDMMWGKYWYRSGINMTMRKELKNIVGSM
jgi:hypothetical protein